MQSFHAVHKKDQPDPSREKRKAGKGIAEEHASVRPQAHSNLKGNFTAMAARAEDGVLEAQTTCRANNGLVLPSSGLLSSSRDRDAHLQHYQMSTKALSRNEFVNALRNNPAAKSQMKEVASRLPLASVNDYAFDVLRGDTLAAFDSTVDVPEHLTTQQLREQADLRVKEDDAKVESLFVRKLHDHFLGGTPRHMPLRLRAKIKMENSPGGRAWDVFQVGLSLIACVMHILSTYKENALEDDWPEEDGEPEVPETAGERWLELIISALFAVDLVLHFFLCEHRGWFFVQTDTVVDVVTLFPVVISLLGTGTAIINTSFLRALRMLRAMRILRAFRVTKNSLSAVDQKVATLVIIVVSIIFMSACLVQTIEKQYGMEDFGVALYFVIVTISTVGYGDYSPATDLGRVVVCLMIIGFMVIVPVKISELAELLSMRSPWHVTYHPKAGYRNILLIGSVLEVAEVEAFLEEFFHPDRMRSSGDLTQPSTEVVILAPYDPSEAMVALLFVPFWHGQVHFIHGSALSDRDLKRAGCKTAEACFILCGKQTSPLRSPQDQSNNQELIDYYDSQNVLYALMVENFNHRCDTFVQIRGIEKRYPLVAAEADVVLCIDRLRMTILGSTALFPGLCTLMSNLFQSCSDSFLSQRAKHELDAGESLKGSWKREYSNSRGTEIYVRPVCAELFTGLSFTQASFVVHRAFSGAVTLLGVEERLVHYDLDGPNSAPQSSSSSSRSSSRKMSPRNQDDQGYDLSEMEMSSGTVVRETVQSNRKRSSGTVVPEEDDTSESDAAAAAGQAGGSPLHPQQPHHGDAGRWSEKELEAQQAKPSFRILRSLVAPGDKYVFPDQRAVNEERVEAALREDSCYEEGESNTVEHVERLQINAYFIAEDAHQADLFSQPSAYLENLLHSLHEFAFLSRGHAEQPHTEEPPQSTTGDGGVSGEVRGSGGDGVSGDGGSGSGGDGGSGSGGVSGSGSENESQEGSPEAPGGARRTRGRQRVLSSKIPLSKKLSTRSERATAAVAEWRKTSRTESQSERGGGRVVSGKQALEEEEEEEDEEGEGEEGGGPTRSSSLPSPSSLPPSSPHTLTPNNNRHHHNDARHFWELQKRRSSQDLEVLKDSEASQRVIHSACALGITGHVVILSPPSSLSSINDCLIPLRACAAVKRPELVPCLNDPIIVLINKVREKDLAPDVLRTIAHYENVFVVFGDHNSVKDLKRAGIMACSSIVILEDNDGLKGQGSEIHTATITKFLSTEQCLTMAMEEEKRGSFDEEGGGGGGGGGAADLMAGPGLGGVWDRRRNGGTSMELASSPQPQSQQKDPARGVSFTNSGLKVETRPLALRTRVEVLKEAALGVGRSRQPKGGGVGYGNDDDSDDSDSDGDGQARKGCGMVRGGPSWSCSGPSSKSKSMRPKRSRGARASKSYVVETNSKTTMAIMNRSVLNRLAHERIDLEVAEARAKSVTSFHSPPPTPTQATREVSGERKGFGSGLDGSADNVVSSSSASSGGVGKGKVKLSPLVSGVEDGGGGGAVEKKGQSGESADSGEGCELAGDDAPHRFSFSKGLSMSRFNTSGNTASMSNESMSLDKIMLMAMTVRAQKRSLRKSFAMEQERMEKHTTEVHAGYTASDASSGGMTPFFAAGYCFSTAVFDNLLVLSYFARGVLRFTESLLGLDPNLRPPEPEEVLSLDLDPSIQGGQIIQIPIPIDPSKLTTTGDGGRKRRRHGGSGIEMTDEEAMLTYSQVFDLMLVNHEAVVLAIYRAPGVNSELPYVSKPKQDDKVHWDDKLFVVAPPHQIELLLRDARSYR